MNAKYKFTGKQIPITVDELKLHINKLLDNYDKGSGNNDFSPYKDPIIYTLSDGRQIEIPKDLQMATIKEREVLKNNKHNKKNREENSDNEDEDDNESEGKENKENNGYSGMSISIVLLILIIVGYFVYKSKYSN
ncbi:MAG: hypothetical protein Edafosvirus10_6 [Edafosvirus sp.]|uniref:Uncharacterized protein n=1 Tax=Edafosvirus sp. TaxID=2487765 RepID=A0A3G4ZWG7_9VIRU|nr:MAG: hypothetical protein Edafosvirus10_6 [Edafosvirus sp.]